MDPIYRDSPRFEGRPRSLGPHRDHAGPVERPLTSTHQGGKRSTVGRLEDRKGRHNGTCQRNAKVPSILLDSHLLRERSHAGGKTHVRKQKQGRRMKEKTTAKRRLEELTQLMFQPSWTWSNCPSARMMLIESASFRSLFFVMAWRSFCSRGSHQIRFS